jgi:hypothetical protein
MSDTSPQAVKQSPEFAALSQEVRQLSTTVTDVVKDFKSFMVSSSQAITQLQSQSASAQQRPLSWQQVTFALSLCVVLSAVMSSWMTSSLNPIMSDLRRVERSADPAEIAVMRYRLSQIEARYGIAPPLPTYAKKDQ